MKEIDIKKIAQSIVLGTKEIMILTGRGRDWSRKLIKTIQVKNKTFYDKHNDIYLDKYINGQHFFSYLGYENSSEYIKKQVI